MNFGQNNFGQMDEQTLSMLLNPQAPGAAPGMGGLGQIPGMGQIMEQAPIPTQARADSDAAYAAGPEMDKAGGGGQMASILGMEAIKGMQSAGNAANRPNFGPPAPVAPRGGKVETKTTDNSGQIDPKLYLLMSQMMGGK